MIGDVITNIVVGYFSIGIYVILFSLLFGAIMYWCNCYNTEKYDEPVAKLYSEIIIIGLLWPIFVIGMITYLFKGSEG